MPSNPSRKKTVRSTGGYSLVELIAASAILATTLTPALELVRDGIELSQESVQRQILAMYAVSQVEEHLALSAATWATGSYSGSLATDGHSSLRYDTFCSDSPADGGVEDRLMTILSTTYYDDNGDTVLSAGELSCTFQTKLARLATYEDEAL